MSRRHRMTALAAVVGALAIAAPAAHADTTNLAAPQVAPPTWLAPWQEGAAAARAGWAAGAAAGLQGWQAGAAAAQSGWAAGAAALQNVFGLPGA